MRYLIILWMTLLSFPAAAQLRIQLDGKKINLISDTKMLVAIDSITINFISPQTQELVYESADSVVLRLFFPLMFDFNRTEDGFDHELLLSISKRNNYFHFSGGGEWIRSFTIHIADNNEHYYGLHETLYPDNRKSPDLRGNIIDLEVNGQQYQYAENFASAWSAFYYTDRGYASFMNTFAKGRYSLGINNQTRLWHETNNIDWYIFTGEARSIYSAYYNVIGSPKKVPYWSCGPIVWRDENKGGAPEVIDDARRLKQMNIPVTALMIDRPYSNGALRWSEMDFDSSFEKPGEWLKKLRDSFNMRLITWVAPATFGDRNFPGLLEGSFTYMDLTHPEAIAELGKRLAERQYAFGVSGHKMDRADEHFPVSEPWYDRTPMAEKKNKYIYLYAKVIDSILKSSVGDEALNYARAAYHGSQQYLSGIWGGDPRSTWEGMAGNLANSIRASYMGFPNWGTDVGGYLGQSGEISDMLYIRWLQWGVFNGIFEIKIDGAGGGGKDRAPWNCSEKVQRAFRAACNMRMEWMPHIYSLLNSSAQYGPLMKPLGMLYPSDTNTSAIWDQYIFGDCAMVVPVLNEEKEKKIYFPEGSWIDYYTHEVIKGGQWKPVMLNDSAIPVFLKEGSIRFSEHIGEGGKKLLQVFVYPGPGKLQMPFVDQLKNDRQSLVTCVSDQVRVSVDLPALEQTVLVKLFSKKRPKAVSVNGRSIAFQHRDNYVVITLKKGRDQNILVVYN